MTKKRAAELWPLIKAFSEGKTVQYRDKANILDRWLNLESPSFEDAFEYRIKPEPREFLLCKDKADPDFGILTGTRKGYNWDETIKVREVLE